MSSIVLFIQYIHNPPDQRQEIYRPNNKVSAYGAPTSIYSDEATRGFHTPPTEHPQTFLFYRQNLDMQEILKIFM